MAKKERKDSGERSGKMCAKKDWHIVCNKDDIKIKKGDDCSDVPKKYWDNLKTEGVL